MFGDTSHQDHIHFLLLKGLYLLLFRFIVFLQTTEFFFTLTLFKLFVLVAVSQQPHFFAIHMLIILKINIFIVLRCIKHCLFCADRYTGEIIVFFPVLCFLCITDQIYLPTFQILQLIFPGFIDIFILPAGILRYLIQIFYSISFVNSAAAFINKISILTICHPYCLCSCFRLCPGRNGQPQKQRKQQHDHHYIFLLTTHLSYLASQSIIT